MRRHTVARLIGILALAASCIPGALAQVPAKEVHVVFHGLLAFVPDETGIYTVHVSGPDNEPHMATLAVELSRLASDNTLDPDFVISGPGGEAIGVWALKGGFALTGENIAAPTEKTDLSPVSGSPTVDDKRIRWVPHMDDIFDGKAQTLDLTQVPKAVAIGRFPVGQLLPLFDEEVHKNEAWEIHKRKVLAVADGVKLKLNLALNAKPVIFQVEREGTPRELKVRSESEVRIASFPLKVPGAHFEHFHHLYALRADKSEAKGPERPTPPTPTPMRCAPVVFCCNQ